MSKASVFVTVGTTSFDLLTKTVSSKETCELLKRLGYSKLILQTGAIDFQIEDPHISGFEVSHFDYKMSIVDDIVDAALVISHAGAGSVLDVLGAGKPLLVVINEELQGNHQVELAHQLSKDGHLYYCSCSNLRDVLKRSNFTKLKPFPPGNPERFTSFLDSVMGFS